MASEVVDGEGTIEERELLMTSRDPKLTGFTPRPVERLVGTKPPRSMTSIECRHITRGGGDMGVSPAYPQLQYLMWVEAGKYTPPFPEKPDPTYNSNVWRNFRQQYGLKSADSQSDKSSVDEMIASMYPINIPKPSKLGECTYTKYLQESDVIKDGKTKRMVIERTKKDFAEFQRLRLRSELRNPPIDKTGNIKPPVNFKRYAHYFVPPTPSPEPLLPPAGNTHTDMFGRPVPAPKRRPYLWKLTYKLNAPEYAIVQELVNNPKPPTRQYPPAITTVKRS